ncbi:hypothetical protein ABMA28_004894 [Loxostege sticticalis]|uniref:BED-type domain-containing protein n=1 Tax=Loxostege sticticalis TaxID=481309 RepID=A0ABD0SNN7_LOXSC
MSGRSELWHHYEKDASSGKAICNVCKEKLSYKSTTANLKSHLKRKHISIYSSLSQPANTGIREQPNTETPPVSEVQVIPSTSKTSQPFSEGLSGNQNAKRQKVMDTYMTKKISKDQKKLIDLDLLDLCTDSFHPFSIVEERAFRKFCKWIPGYELPTRKTLSNSIMQEAYTKLYDSIKAQLSHEVTSICLTADLWTSLKTESYIALTGHYLTEQLDFKTVLLGCCQFEGHHTSANIAAEIGILVDKYGLRDKVNFMITDNASNVVKAVKEELKWKHFGCYAHSLNLVVEDALKLVQPRIDKVKRIVMHVKKSNLSSERLQKHQVQQGQEPKRLIQSVDTRWNSTYYMLKRFVELEEAVRSILGFVDRSLPCLSPEDWTLYNQLCQILRPFEEITNSMSGEKYITGSSVIIVTRCLKEACQKIIERTDLLPEASDTVHLLKAGLKDRFNMIEQSGTFALTTFMDPRFKMQGFSDQNEATKTRERVRKLVAALIAQNENPAAPTTVSEDTGDDLSPWSIFDQMVAKSSAPGTPLSKAIKEVDMYLSDELLPRKDPAGKLSCPLEWWKKHQYVYPNLKKVFVAHCNIVATSVPCERMFSKTGLILNQRRTRLTTGKVEQIMFLNVNTPQDRFKGF